MALSVAPPTLVLCEKPSQGRDIARVIGARQRRENYLEGSGYRVTWCVGHLLEQAPPEHYAANLRPWRLSRLPILPQQWQLQPRAAVQQQFATIAHLLTEAHHLIIATDADREGELIARELLTHCHYRGTIERLWLSALDDRSIERAFAQLRPGTQSEPLYYAGLGRQRADWLLGMNLTMAISALHAAPGSGALSVGRVQTPTLKLVVDRDREIAQFVPVPYFLLRVQFNSLSGTPRSVWCDWQVPKAAQGDAQGRCLDRQRVERVAAQLTGAPATVLSRSETPKQQPPPLCLSLSELQKRASARFGMSAKRVLEVAQSLYERHKATSYPRSDCGYLPTSMRADAAPLLATLAAIDPQLKPLIERCDANARSPVWNDAKLTAHHAIIPTLNRQVSLAQMSGEEQRIYDLIRRHYLAQFLGNHHYMASQLLIACVDERFSASGRRTTEPGWHHALSDEPIAPQQSPPEPPIPLFEPGEAVTPAEHRIDDKQTTPPPHYSEGTLIAAMKGIGRQLTDSKLKAILRETAGIGTEATRAAIIETLLQRRYLARSGRKLIATDRGRALIEVVPEMIKDPATTARWEQALDDVASGRLTLDHFLASQVALLQQMLTTLQPTASTTDRPEAATAAVLNRSPTEQRPEPAATPIRRFPCPHCDDGYLERRQGSRGPFWGCTNYRYGCRMSCGDDQGRPRLG